MAEGDTIVVRDGHQTLGPATVLTGGQTEAGYIFRGPDDPADTPALLAILEPGDLWIDTTGTAPFSHKERNWNNDGWDLAAAVLKDGAGSVIASIAVDPDGTITIAGPLGAVHISDDGTLEFGQTSAPTGAVRIFPLGAVEITNDSGGKVELSATGGIMLSNLVSQVELAAGGGLSLLVNSLTITNPAAPEVPATPTEQDIVDALIALGLVTQAAP